MNLNKNNLLVGAMANKDGSHYNLNSIHLTKKFTEATDGHMLCRIDLPEQFEPEDVPIMVKTDKADFFDDAILSLDGLKNVKFTKSQLPIVDGQVYIDVESSNKNGKVKMATTDLDNVFETNARKIDGNYPDINLVLPKTPAKFRIGVSAKLLREMADLIVKGKKGTDALTVLEFRSEVDPIMFLSKTNEGQKITGLIMPMRLDTQEV
jgi:DNA polymerase III sliding clamp (beta) subunit (PCNA family)